MLLGAIGFVLAVGHYDVGAYLWLEGLFVLGTFVLVVPLLRALGAAAAGPRPAAAPSLSHRAPAPRAVRRASTTSGVTSGCSPRVFVFTTAIQAVRILSIWAGGRAVGIELGPRIYYVMGPLFFLVLLVPFTLNGIAVREAFFVSFLGSVGVAPDAAFASGFLFFLVTTALALPGAAILLWEGIRGGSRPRLEHG